MNTNKIRILNRIKEIVNNGWCQGAFARRADNSICYFADSEARQFCLLGAISKATTEIMPATTDMVYYDFTNHLKENI